MQKCRINQQVRYYLNYLINYSYRILACKLYVGGLSFLTAILSCKGDKQLIFSYYCIRIDKTFLLKLQIGKDERFSVFTYQAQKHQEI